eukprot:TRINITY_DN5693_c0_g1_i2.p1 TRINITY_DN5693_c0_g1~~TRINITY_DN5693_c0_g1_i2.p1  ORF type:complete len:705 (+),score=108.92 TRINITY_DN5693_c0_g1_i2:468-2582(+)
MKRHYCADAEGSVPKEWIYNHYVELCEWQRLTPSKNNIFSKMLKKVFPGVRSRRLGPRGKGIPHYGGIRSISGSQEEGEDYVPPLSQQPPIHTDEEEEEYELDADEEDDKQENDRSSSSPPTPPTPTPKIRRSTRARKIRRVEEPHAEEQEYEADEENENEEEEAIEELEAEDVIPDDDIEQPNCDPPGQSNLRPPISEHNMPSFSSSPQPFFPSYQPQSYQPQLQPQVLPQQPIHQPYPDVFSDVYTRMHHLNPAPDMAHVKSDPYIPAHVKSDPYIPYYCGSPTDFVERKDYMNDLGRIKEEKQTDTGLEYDSSPEGHGFYSSPYGGAGAIGYQPHPFPLSTPAMNQPEQHLRGSYTNDSSLPVYLPPSSARLDHYHYHTPTQTTTTTGYLLDHGQDGTESAVIDPQLSNFYTASASSSSPIIDTTTIIAPSRVQQTYMSLPPYTSSCPQCDPVTLATTVTNFEKQYLLPRYLFRTPPGDLPYGIIPSLPPLRASTMPLTGMQRCLHQDVDEVLDMVVQADDLAWRLHLNEQVRQSGSIPGNGSTSSASSEGEQFSALRAELAETKSRLEEKYLAVAQAVRQLGWGAGGQVHLWLVAVLALVQEALGEHDTALRTASLAVKVLREWHLRPGFVIGAGSLDLIDPLLQLLMDTPSYQLEVTHCLSMLKTQPYYLQLEDQSHMDCFHRKWNQRCFFSDDTSQML